VLGPKNTLTAHDAEHVEQTFQLKTRALTAHTSDEPSARRKSENRPAKRRNKQRRSGVINKSLLMFPAARRTRDREHVKSVAKQACLIAADVLQMPTISDTRNHPHSVARSATSSMCRSAAAIIAKSIAVAMKPLGVSARALWLKTHRLPRQILKPHILLWSSITDGNQWVTRVDRSIAFTSSRKWLRRARVSGAPEGVCASALVVTAHGSVKTVSWPPSAV
jgi:hypothetical protein